MLVTATKPETLAGLRASRGGITQAAVASAAELQFADLSRFEAGHLICSPDRQARIVAAYASECGASEAEVRELLPARYRVPAEKRREAVPA